MVVISVFAIASITINVFIVIQIRKKAKGNGKYLNLLLLSGLLAYFVPVLLNTISIYWSAIALEQAGDVSWKLVASRVKAVTISEIYGLAVCLFSLITWGVLNVLRVRKMCMNRFFVSNIRNHFLNTSQNCKQSGLIGISGKLVKKSAHFLLRSAKMGIISPISIQ